MTAAPESAPPEDRAPSLVERLALQHRASGVVTAFITTILAFFIGGLVVLATGHNPFSTYKGIFNGTGLNWFFPWISSDDRIIAEFNLQQTLLTTTTLMLTGLAVAFAFRCGLFNIGGQGQYTMGAIVATWVGASFIGLNSVAHILLAIVLASLVGAAWAGVAGMLKATVGAHEVIATIMLNWIAYWIGSYAFGQGGPLQNTDPERVSVPISNDIDAGAHLPVFWGDPEFQGLHIGFLIAIAALVGFWLLNRKSVV